MVYSTTNKYLGIVQSIYDNAQIYVIAESSDEFKLITEKDKRKLFPPNGLVFAPSLFKRIPDIKVNDLIEFDCTENEKKFDKDKTKDSLIINPNSVKKHYIKLICGESKISNYHFDIKNYDFRLKGYHGDFYVYHAQKVYGRFRMDGAKVIPAYKKNIYAWDESSCLIYKYGPYNLYLLKEPLGELSPIDCMDETQLFEWFRNLLKSVKNNEVQQLDNKTNWRKEIPELFKSMEDIELLKVRFDRIKKIMANSNESKKSFLNFLNSPEITNFIKNPDNDSNLLLKTDIGKDYNQELEKEKVELLEQINALQSVILVKENEFNDLIDNINKKTSTKEREFQHEIDYLREDIKNKEQLLLTKNNEIESLRIEILSLKKGANQNTQNVSTSEITYKDVSKRENDLTPESLITFITELYKKNLQPLENGFVLQRVEKQSDHSLCTNIQDFIIQLENCLTLSGINKKLARTLIDLTRTYNAIIVSKIEIAIAFIKATANAVYIIQQVEPDWLHFSDFWRNGIGSIWKSAHNHPDIIHVLLLEDVNLASPECYARPLLDLISGFRDIIPFGETSYPRNLIIFASIISYNNPEIGLPIIKNTFKNWGAIGFTEEVFGDRVQNNKEIISKYVDINLLKKISSVVDIKLIKENVEKEFQRI